MAACSVHGRLFNEDAKPVLELGPGYARDQVK
jgi:hypothetical protein